MNLSKNQMRIMMIIGIAFVVFTVIAFAAPFKMNAVFWVAYVFGVIAIAAQAYIQPKAFQGEGARSKFYGFPIARVGVYYLIAQLIVSLVFMALAAFVPAWVVLIVSVLILAAAAVGLIATESVREEVERQDVKIKQEVGLMRSLQSKTAAMAGQCAGASYETPVKKLAEEFRFSDPVSGGHLAEAERELSAVIDLLQQAIVDGDRDSVEELCKKASLALAERNRLCKLGK